MSHKQAIPHYMGTMVFLYENVTILKQGILETKTNTKSQKKLIMLKLATYFHKFKQPTSLYYQEGIIPSNLQYQQPLIFHTRLLELATNIQSLCIQNYKHQFRNKQIGKIYDLLFLCMLTKIRNKNYDLLFLSMSIKDPSLRQSAEGSEGFI